MTDQKTKSPGKDEGLHNIRPLTDEDCAIFYDKLKGPKAEPFAKICERFVSKIKDMLKIIESKCLTDKEKTRIAQSHQLARLAPDREIFIRCFQKIWVMRTSITTKNAEWIKNQDYSHLVKKDSKQDMINGIISLVKDSWDSLTPDETQKYWRVMQELLVETASFITLLNA